MKKSRHSLKEREERGENQHEQDCQNRGAGRACPDLWASTACADFSADKSITVISREEGSGTRGAFVELTGVEQKIDGKKVDMTTDDAQITNNTAAMLMTVAGDTQAIGYVSLGSLNETVKAVKIEGVEATAQNVADGSSRLRARSTSPTRRTARTTFPRTSSPT